MAILFMDTKTRLKDAWMKELSRALPDEELRAWPEGIGDASDIEFAVVGKECQ